MNPTKSIYCLLAVGMLAFTGCQTEEKFESEVALDNELKMTLAAEQQVFDDNLPVVQKMMYGTEISLIDLGNNQYGLGDMVVDQDYLDRSNQTDTKGVIRRNNGIRWPNRTLLYRHSNNMPQATKDKVVYAANYITNNTDLRVRKWNSNDSAGYVWINYVEGDGCQAQIGYRNKKFPGQTMNLASTCSRGTTIHEFLHSAGVMHEQQHWNRDAEVEVLTRNIIDSREGNYIVLPNADGYEPSSTVDLNSIMMYGSFFWQTPQAEANGWRTMRTRSGGTIVPNRSFMTQKDINVINGWY